MRNYVTGGLIVVLVILEYLLAFTVPGVLLALNILLTGAYLYFKISKNPLADDPMIRGGAGVIALALLLLLVYVLGFNAVPKAFKQELLASDSAQRDEMVNATAMLSKIAENEEKMISRNLQNLDGTDPNPALTVRVEEYDFTLFEPMNEDFQSRVRSEILEPVAGQYLTAMAALDPEAYPTLEEKQALMQMLEVGNKIVSQHLSAISGYVSFVRFINLLFPLFILYLIGLAVLYVRSPHHKECGVNLVRGEIMNTVAWVAILVVMFIAGGSGENPFTGTAMLLLVVRLVVQAAFLVMAFTGRSELLSNPIVKAVAQLLAVFFLFYALISFVVVGPDGVNEGMVSAMQKLSVFVYILAGFFALGVIIASVSRKAGAAFDNPGLRGFMGVLSLIAKIVLGVIIIAVFSSLGMFTDNPGVMVPVYFVFFLLVFGGVLVNTWMKHNKHESDGNMARIVRKVLGAVLLLACLLLPVYSMQSLFPGFFDKVTEHPQGDVQITNAEKNVVITWDLNDMQGVERFNIARGDGKEPEPGETPKKLNDYDIVRDNVLFEVRDNRRVAFEHPYYYWVEELRADDAPMFSEPYAYIPVDVTMKNLEEVFEQTDFGYIHITNDSLTNVITYRTNDTGVIGVNIHRGDSPDALQATRVEQEDGTWITNVNTNDSVVEITSEPAPPVADNTLRFIDAEGLQYGWNYYWIIEARMADGTKAVYAPFTYSPVSSDTPPTEELELKTLSIAFNIGKALLLIVITAVVMFIGGAGVFVINRFKDNNLALAIVGYIILFVTAAVPALLMMQVDSSYSSLGVAYYTAVLIALLSWWGVAMVTARAKRNAAA